MTDLTLAAFLLIHDVLIVVVLAFVYRARLAPPAPPGSSLEDEPSEAPEPEDPPEPPPARSRSVHRGEAQLPADVPALLGEVEGLAGLYEPLGFSPVTAASCRATISEMKGLVQAEVLDYSALHQALTRLKEDEPRFQRLNEALLHDILAAGQDEALIHTLLNRDPINEALPFVEQIPVVKDGQTVWRTPVEHAIIRKRPTDSGRFLALLDDLEALATETPHRTPEALRELSEHIERVRDDTHRESAYTPTNLTALDAVVSRFIDMAPNPEALARRHHLDHLLERILVHKHHNADPDRAVPPDTGVAALISGYLEATWCRHPWLTRALLLLALDLSDIDTHRDNAQLERVFDEIASGFYDPEETRARLRRLEDAGTPIHSLTYALLKLDRST